MEDEDEEKDEDRDKEKASEVGLQMICCNLGTAILSGC